MSDKYTAKDISHFLEAANSDLALNKYKAKDMIPDYCKAVLIGFQLQAKLATIKDEIRRLRDAKGTCGWSFREAFDGEKSWDTECGTSWTFMEGGIKDNGAVFCQKCGRLIKQALKESDHEV